jgi:REP element-mobilizing transposase RayT
VLDRVWNLRSKRGLKALRRAFAGSCERFGFRLVHYSVQGNHLHLIAEAPDRVALSRAMKGLCVRIARGLNALMGTRGPVFTGRYYARPLRTPLEVRRALLYVLANFRRHQAQVGRQLPTDFLDPFSSARHFDGWRSTRGLVRALALDRDPCVELPTGIQPPHVGLLRIGWRRYGLLDPTATPGPSAARLPAWPEHPVAPPGFD